MNEDTIPQSVIELKDEEGKTYKFNHLDSYEFEDKLYIILQPAEKMEGMEEDEMIFFEATEDEGDEYLIKAVEDEELLERIYNAYVNEATAEEENED